MNSLFNTTVPPPALIDIDDDLWDDDDAATKIIEMNDTLHNKCDALEIENLELRQMNQRMLLKGRECADCKRNYKRLFRKYQRLLIEMQRLTTLSKIESSSSSSGIRANPISAEALEMRRLQAMLRLNV